MALICSSSKNYIDLSCIDSVNMELETVTIDDETYTRCRCKEKHTFYNTGTSQCLFGGSASASFALTSGAATLQSRSIDFMYTSKTPNQLFMASTSERTNQLFVFQDNKLNQANLFESVTLDNTGGFFWNTIVCDGDKMSCVDGTDRLWRVRYSFTTRTQFGFFKNPGFAQSSAGGPASWFRVKKVFGRDYVIAGGKNHQTGFAGGSNLLVRANFALTQADINEFNFNCAGNLVDISTVKIASSPYFLAVSDSNGVQYNYEIFDHTSSNPNSVAQQITVPNPVSDNTRPRCLDFDWSGEDRILRLSNDGRIALSTGYQTLNVITDVFSYQIPQAASANEIMWIPFTDLAAIGTYTGSVIFTSAVTDQLQSRIYVFQHTNNQLVRLYHMPRRSEIAVLFFSPGGSTIQTFEISQGKCQHPLALTCDAKNQFKSIDCKPNSNLKNFGSYSQCYCDDGFFYNLDLKTCDQCPVFCVSGLCDGPLAANCVHMKLTKSSLNHYGISQVKSLVDDSNYFSGYLEFRGNNGKAYSLDLSTKLTSEKREFTDSRSEGIEPTDSLIRIQPLDNFAILLGSKIRRLALNSEVTPAQRFINYKISNYFGSYHAYSLLENSNFMIVAMNKVSDINQAQTTPRTIFRFDLLDPEAEPVQWIANRDVRNIKFTRYISNYIFVVFQSYSRPYNVASNPTRQIFSGIANTNNTSQVTAHEFEQYDNDIDLEVVNDATSNSLDFTMIVLSYPNYLYRRRVTDGLERDLRVLNGFSENLDTQEAISIHKVSGSSHLIIQSSAGKVAIWNYHDDSWRKDIIYISSGGLGQRSGYLMQDNGALMIPANNFYLIVALPDLSCYKKNLLQSCDPVDRRSAVSCISGSQSEIFTFQDIDKQRSQCVCQQDYVFSLASSSCVAVSSNPSVQNLCADKFAVSCTDNTFEGTELCRGASIKDEFSKRCICPQGTYLPASNRECVICSNYPTSCAGNSGEITSTINPVHKFQQRTPNIVRIHGACPVEVELSSGESLTHSFYGFMTIEEKDVRIWSLDLSQANPQNRVTQKSILVTATESQPFGHCSFKHSSNSIFSIGQYYRVTSFSSGNSDFSNADIATSNYQNDGTVQNLVENKPNSIYWFFGSSQPLSLTTTLKRLYRMNQNSATVDQFGLFPYFFNDFSVDTNSDFIIGVFQSTTTSSARVIVSSNNLDTQTLFSKPQSAEEKAVVKLEGYDYYAVTFQSTLLTYKFSSFNDQVHSISLSDIGGDVDLLIQIPYGTFVTAFCRKTSKIAITTVLNILNKTPRYESLGFQQIEQVQFYKYRRILLVSNDAHNFVNFYQLPEYRCEQPLATCGSDPRVISGCVQGAILDLGVCRCLLGSYNNLAGECIPCNGCSTCTGPNPEDCGDPNNLLFRLESDQASSDPALNFQLNRFCTFEQGQLEKIYMISSTKISIFTSNIDFSAIPTFEKTLVLSQDPAPSPIDSSLGFCKGFFNSRSILLTIQTIHNYDPVTETQSQYTSVANPYSNINSGINVQNSVYIPPIQRWLLSTTQSNLLVTIGLTSTVQSFSKAASAAVSMMIPVLNSQVLIGYNSNNVQRALINVMADSSVFTLVSSFSKESTTRDLAGVYIVEPLNSPSAPCYMILFGENRVQKLNSNTGAEIFRTTLAQWTKTDTSKQGFMVELAYSDFIATARQDEKQFCIVNYQTNGSNNRCVETSMNDIAGMEISTKFRYVYLADRFQNFIHIFLLPEIGCDYDPLIKSCGNIFRNYTTNIACKDNASLLDFHRSPKMCRCNAGFYYEPSDKTCKPCHSNCSGHCFGQGTSNCYDFVIQKTEESDLHGIAFVDTRQNFKDGFLGLITAKGDTGKVYQLNFSSKSSTLRKTLALNPLEAAYGLPQNTTLSADNLGNLIFVGQEIRYSSAQSAQNNLIQKVYSNIPKDGVYQHLATRPNNQIFFVAVQNQLSGSTGKIIRLDRIIYEIIPAVYTTSGRIQGLHWEQRAANRVVVIFQGSSSTRQVFDATVSTDTSTPVLVQTKPAAQVEIDISGPGTDTIFYFVLIEDNILQIVSSISASNQIVHTHTFSNMRALNKMAKVIKSHPLSDTRFSLISTNLDRVILYNWFSKSFVRFVQVGYNLIGQIVAFTNQRHIAVVSRDIVAFIHIPELPCLDVMAASCSTTNADSSVSCTSTTLSTLSSFSDLGETNSRCMCGVSDFFNFQIQGCSTSSTNSCLDTRAHACTFTEFSSTTRCIPNSQFDDLNRCICDVGFYDDSNIGRGRTRCFQCQIPGAPCLGPNLTVDQGVLPFEIVVASHATRRIHGACIVETPGGSIGVTTVRARHVNYYSFDPSRSTNKLRHEKYFSLSGTFSEDSPVTMCKHGIDDDVVIFDSNVRKVSVKSSTGRNSIIQSGMVTDGSVYNTLAKIPNTKYILAAYGVPSSGLTAQLVYRVSSEDLTYTSFTVAGYITGFGIIHERVLTTQFIATFRGRNFRKIYDTSGVEIAHHSKINTSTETALVKMSIGNYYVSGYNTEFFTTNLFDGSQMMRATISEITQLQQFVEVPYSNFVAATSIRELIIIIPVLGPIPSNIAQRRINLGFSKNVQIEFFLTSKHFMITGSDRNILAVYGLSEYPCSKYLSTGCNDLNPDSFTRCVDNAVEDNGRCRCKVGFYDNLYGTCVQCNSSCYACVGPLAANCTLPVTQSIENDLSKLTIAEGLWNLNNFCNLVRNDIEEFFIIQGRDVIEISSNQNFDQKPTFKSSLQINQAPPVTGAPEKRGVCVTSQQMVYFGLSTVHSYDGLVPPKQLIMPPPYNIPNPLVLFEHIVETKNRYLIIGSRNITELIIKQDQEDDLKLPIAASPSSVTALQGDIFLVTFNSTTINQRHLFNASMVKTSQAPTMHTKSQLNTRDLASTFISVPISNFDVPLYFVLTNENVVEEVNALTGASLMLFTISSWTSTNVTMQGFIQELKFSDFVVAARQDTPTICIVNYVTINSGNRCIHTGMTEISGMSISMKYRHLYVSDRRQEFISTFQLPEIGCGYNRLTLSCGNQFKDFSPNIPNIVCKPNASRVPYFNMIDQCRCNRGFYYDQTSRTCVACLSGCVNCNGPNLVNCHKFFIDTKSANQVSVISSFDTSVVDADGTSGILTLTGSDVKAFRLEVASEISIQVRSWTVGQTASTEPRIMSSKIFANSRGEVLVFGRKITQTNMITGSSLQEVPFTGFAEDGYYSVVAATNRSLFFFTAVSVPDTSAAPGARELIRFHQTFPENPIFKYSTSNNIKAIHWKDFSNFIIVSHSEASSGRQIFDVTATNLSTASQVSLHAKTLLELDVDITSPDDENPIYITIMWPLWVRSHSMVDGSIIFQRSLNQLVEMMPNTLVTRVLALRDSNFVAVLSNWHSYALWNFATNETPIYYRVGYNLMNDLATFSQFGQIAISNFEGVFIFNHAEFICRDRLALTCLPRNIESSSTCKAGSTLVPLNIEGVLVRKCYCNENLPYFNPTSGICEAVKANPFCPDELAETCKADNLRTLTCAQYAVIDLRTDTCRCSVGSYQSQTTSKKVCLRCENYPESCSGPNPLQRSIDLELQNFFRHDTRHTTSTCVLENGSFSGFVTISGNTANTYQIQNIIPRVKHVKFTPMDREIVANSGKCMHFQNGIVLTLNQKLRRFNALQSQPKTVTYLSFNQIDGSVFDIVQKIPGSSDLWIAASSPISGSSQKAFYRVSSSMATPENPKQTFQTSDYISALAVRPEKSWVLVTFSSPTSTTREFYNFASQDSVVSSPVKVHTKTNSFREVGVFFAQFIPVYVVAFSNQVNVFDEETDNRLIQANGFPSITTITHLVQIPNSYFYIVFGEQNHFVISPQFEIPVNINTEIVHIGFKGVSQIEFFTRQKYLLISSKEAGLTTIIRMQKYLCNQPLKNCGEDPATFNKCVDNAIEFNGLCRCLLGFYDDFIGQCLQCHPSCTECVGPFISDCINTSSGEDGIRYNIYNDLTPTLVTDPSKFWQVNDICTQMFFDQEFYFLFYQNNITIFKAAVGFGSIPTFFHNITTPITHTVDSSLPALRSNCAQAGAQNIVIGSDTLHLLNLGKNSNTTSPTFPVNFNLQEYVLPGSYEAAKGKTLFDLLVYLPQRNRILAGSSDVGYSLGVFFSLSLYDPNDVVSFNIGVTPVQIGLMADDRILMIFSNTSLKRRIYKFNTQKDSFVFEERDRQFPNARELALATINSIYPNQKSDLLNSIYLVIADENILEKARQSDGAFLDISVISEWISRDQTKKAMMRLVPISTYIVCARQDERRIVFRNYGTNSNHRVVDSNMIQVSSFVVSQQFKQLCIVDSIRGRVSFFEIPEFRCDHGNLSQSCNRIITDNVVCKSNAVFKHVERKCVCTAGFYENELFECASCPEGCLHCTGSSENDCMIRSSSNINQVISKQKRFHQVCHSVVVDETKRSPFWIWAVEGNQVSNFRSDHVARSPFVFLASLDILGVNSELDVGYCRALNTSMVHGNRGIHLVESVEEVLSAYEYIGIDKEKGYYNLLRSTEDQRFIFVAMTHILDLENPAQYFYRVELLRDKLNKVVKYSLPGRISAFNLRHHEKFVIVSPRNLNDPNVYFYQYTLDDSLFGTVNQAAFTFVRTNPRVEVAIISHTTKLEPYVVVEENPAVSVYAFGFAQQTITLSVSSRTELPELGSLLCTEYSQEIRNSFTIIITTNSDIVIVFNYKDFSKRLIETKLGENLNTAFHILEWRRLLVSGGSQNLVAYISLPEAPCHDNLALTCNELDPRVIESCKENSQLEISGQGQQFCKCINRFFKDESAEECVRCQGTCLSCIERTEQDCTACGFLARLRPVSLTPKFGDCFCERGFLDLRFLSCSVCPFNCYKCLSPNQGDCEFCLPGYAPREGGCVDCSEPDEKDPGCPTANQLSFVLSDGKQAIVSDETLITLKIDRRMPDEFVRRGPSVQQYFILRVVRKEDSGLDELPISEVKITVGGTTPNEFTQIQMRRTALSTLNPDLYSSVTVQYLNPQLHSFVNETNPFNYDTEIIYLKRVNITAAIEASTSDLDTKKEAEAEKNVVANAKSIATAVNTAAAVGIATSMAVVVKYFQIVDVLMNTLGKINVKLGPDIERIIKILQELQFPTFSFMERFSPVDDGGKQVSKEYVPRIERTDTNYAGTNPAYMLKQRRVLEKQQRIKELENMGRVLSEQEITDLKTLKSEPEEGDPPNAFFDYIVYRRGSRGKMGVKNEDLFIFWGQNAILSWLLILLTFVVFFLGVGYKKEFIVWKLITKLYHVLITAFFIKFLFVAFSEIALRTFVMKQPWYYYTSYFTSYIVLNIYVFDIMRVWYIIKKGMSLEEAEKMPFHIQMAHEESTKNIHPDARKAGNTFLVKEKIRWFIIFLLISTMQLLNRTQAFLIFMVDLLYFCQAMLELKRTQVFEYWFFKVKTIAQETAILFFLSVLFIFGTTRNSGFTETKYAGYLERAVFIAVILAILAEAMTMIGLIVTNTYKLIKGLKEARDKKKKEEEQKAKKLEYEKLEKEQEKMNEKNSLNENTDENSGKKPLSHQGDSKQSINSSTGKNDNQNSSAENVEIKTTKSKTKIMGIKNYKSTLESDRQNIPNTKKNANNLPKQANVNSGDIIEPIAISEESSREKKPGANQKQKPSQFYQMSNRGDKKSLSQFAPLRNEEIDIQIKEMTPSESQKIQDALVEKIVRNDDVSDSERNKLSNDHSDANLKLSLFQREKTKPIQQRKNFDLVANLQDTRS